MRIVFFYALCAIACAVLASPLPPRPVPCAVGCTRTRGYVSTHQMVGSSGGSDDDDDDSDTEAIIVGLVVLGVVMLLAAAIVLWLVARACIGPSLALPHPTYLELAPADDTQRQYHHHSTAVFATR